MAVSWTRRAVSLVGPLLVAVAISIAVSGRGCEDNAGSPEVVVRQFVEAAKQMDREAMFEMLGPRTRELLSAEALRATDLSPRRYAASDMIFFNTALADLSLEELEVRVVASTETSATVKLRDRRGREHRVALVKVDGDWKIELAQ